MRNIWICRKIWISRTAQILREIVYILCVECLVLQKIEYPDLRKFNKKLFTLYMYSRSGFAEKLNIQKSENSMGNCVHYICTKRLDLRKNWISQTVKIQREFGYIIYVRNVCIYRKIECPKVRKFIGKLCTLYVYKMFGLEKKLNVQCCENSTENCVHYICTECLD